MKDPNLMQAAFAAIVAALLLGVVADKRTPDTAGLTLIFVAIVLLAYGLVVSFMYFQYHKVALALRSPELAMMQLAREMSPEQLAYVVGGTLVLTPLDNEPFYIEIGAERITASWFDSFLVQCRVQFAKTGELVSVRDYSNDGTDQRHANMIIDMLANRGQAIKRRGQRALWTGENSPYTVANEYGLGWGE